MKQNIDINNTDYNFNIITAYNFVNLELYKSVGKMPCGYIEYPNDKLRGFSLEQTEDGICNINITPKYKEEINIDLYLPNDCLNSFCLYDKMDRNQHCNETTIKDFKVEKMNLHGEAMLLKNSTIDNLLVSKNGSGFLDITDCHIKNLHITHPFCIAINNSNIESICIDEGFITSMDIVNSYILEITSNSNGDNLVIENSKIEKTNLSKGVFKANSSLIGNININEGWLSLVNCNFNQNNDISINKGDIYLTLKDDQILKRKIFNKKIGSIEENKKVLTKLKTKLGYIIKKD